MSEEEMKAWFFNNMMSHGNQQVDLKSDGTQQDDPSVSVETNPQDDTITTEPSGKAGGDPMVSKVVTYPTGQKSSSSSSCGPDQPAQETTDDVDPMTYFADLARDPMEVRRPMSTEWLRDLKRKPLVAAAA